MYKPLIVMLFILCWVPQANAFELQTALEKSAWSELTNHDQMMAYLEPLADSSANVTMKFIGTSVAGRPIPALFFSDDPVFGSRRGQKPVVMIFCQQHGDEPSGKEAALILARRLLGEDAGLLEKLDLILVPQVNPDGSEAGKRRNANDMDLNRNHVILSEPESNALHQLFLDWMPEVTLDVHEYNAVLDDWVEAGYIKDADEMLGGVTNRNIDPEIIAFTRNIFIPEAGQGIEDDGYRFHRYIVGNPFTENVMRYSTTAINDGRQSMGIYNTLSFIFEGKRYGNLINEIEKRTRGQVSAMVNFLKTVDRHAADMISIVTQARARMADVQDSYIQMDYYPDEKNPVLTFPVFDLKTWTHTYRDFDVFRPVVKVKKSVKKPAAYAFAATETRLMELLNKHRIPVLVLENAQQTATETYHVKYVTEAVDEEKPTVLVDLETTVQLETLPAGTIVVPVQGKASNLIPLMFEPESTWRVASRRSGDKYRFNYLDEGKPYPVKRLVSLENLALDPAE